MKKVIALIISLPLTVFSAEWQSLNGPPAGRADDMSMGQDGSTWVIYAADRTHKLYKSVNEGEYWDSIYTHPEVTNPTCVITEPNYARVVYIGKNDATPVWKSTDWGQTWESKSYGITNTNPLCFAMDPNNPNVIYAGFEWYTDVDYTIFRTINGGEQWNPCGSSSLIHSYTVRDIWVNPNSPQILYVATNNSVWKSIDGGDNWIRLNPPAGLTDIYCLTLNTDILPNALFVGVRDWDGDCGVIYRTQNDGSTWQEVFRLGPYLPTPEPTVLEIEKNTAGQIMYTTFWPWGFYKSTNYGNSGSWFESNNGIVDRNLRSLIQHPQTPGWLFVGAYAALYKSANYGNLWQERIDGYKLADITHISTINANIFETSYTPFDQIDGIIKSYDAGDNWQWVYIDHDFEPTDVEIAPSNTDIIYASYWGDIGHIIKTVNGGLNWENYAFAKGITDITLSYTNPDSAYASSSIFGVGGPSVFYTYNGWVSYYEVPFTFEGRLNAIEADPQYSNIVYTAGYTFDSPYLPKLYKTTNGGQSWSLKNNGLSGALNAVGVDPIKYVNIYCGGEDGIFKTIDAANNWVFKNSGLPWYHYYNIDIQIDPEEPAILYALMQQNYNSDENYLYCSVDGAAEWFQFTLELGQNPPVYINDLTIDNSQSDKVYAATPKGTYVFYPHYVNKHLTSSSSEATSKSQGRKLIRIEDSYEFWATYESGGVVFAVHTTDMGQSWSKKMEIGQGYNPAISIRTGIPDVPPCVVWLAKDQEENQDVIYFSRHISDQKWTTPVQIKISEPGVDFGPPSFVIDNSNYGHLVYADGSSIKYTNFDIYDPNPTVSETVGNGDDPCIGFMTGLTEPPIHVTWEDNSVIKYRARTVFGWGTTDIVSSSDSQDPSLEIGGTNVYVVWSANRNIYWRYAVYTGGNHYWSRYCRVDDTNDPSVSPVLTGGYTCAWVDQVSEGSEVYFSHYDPEQGGWIEPINVSTSSDELYSNYPHIVHKQVYDIATKVYFIWTEGSETLLPPTAPPYDIVFKEYVLWNRDGSQVQALPFYIADGGEENASPFNLRRDGYHQYGPEPYKRIDYDAQYLEYQFANLNPDRAYSAGVYLYQHGSANLAISAEVDGYQIGALNLSPDTLIILRHMIPAAFYTDSMIHVKIYGNNAVSAILVLYEYEIESNRGGPQSSQSLPDQASVLALSILPNPAKENIGVRYTLPMTTNVKLTLFDVTGRVIEHIVNDNQVSGTFRKSFRNVNLSQGVYFVRLKTDDQSLVEKVILLR